jgi:xanthine dehydrogenase YagR molybdenum-binding subunit
MFRRGAELIGWDRRLATGSQTSVLRRGFGMGAASWPAFDTRAAAEVVVDRDGSVELRTGTQDIGTGQRTVMGVLVADQIGIPLSLVEVSIGRSSFPPGPGSGGSMTGHNTAPAVLQAAENAKRDVLELVGRRAGVEPNELEIEDGEVLHDRSSVMSWTQACSLIPDGTLTARGERNAESDARFRGEGHSHGAQFAEVVVDVETGVIRVERIVAIQACGRVMARKTAESQIIGGVVQGLSFALFEDKRLDRNTGAMVNPNLEWYKVAGTADMPHIIPVLWTEGQTGVRSLGEPPTIPTAGAIACAVYNAIGTPVRHLPLRPDRVLAALEGGDA